MKLQNETEFDNSQRKLAALLKLIEKKETSSTHSLSREISLESMKLMAKRLTAEVQEYERAHQTN
jgi:hypothetical protein